jgi:RHS repeat-associated protein
LTNYSYDKLNRLTGSSINGVPTSYGHDRNGNRTSKTVNGSPVATYVYDTANRLVEARNGAGTVVFKATYDARTRRLSKTEGATATKYRYDDGTNFQEVQGTSVVTELIRAGGLGGGIGSVVYSDKSMAPTPGPVEHFVSNPVGHSVALTRADASVSQSSMYEAFGDTVWQSGTSTNNRLANTKERDGSIGLDNHGMRYYDPDSGRYVSRDPIGYADGSTSTPRWETTRSIGWTRWGWPARSTASGPTRRSLSPSGGTRT